MNGCIAGCQYIPSVEYFAHWKHHGHLLLEKEEHYVKRTWRNKTAIQDPIRPLLLTVPLMKGKNQQTNISEVRIAYHTPWQKNHLQSFQTAYGKTAFFEEIQPELERIFKTPYDTLWKLNIDLLHLITSLLGGSWRYDVSTVYHHEFDYAIKDLRHGVPCGLSSGVGLLLPKYPQVHRIHKTHQSNLCILDALCHLGPETSDYLTRYAAKLYG